MLRRNILVSKAFIRKFLFDIADANVHTASSVARQISPATFVTAEAHSTVLGPREVVSIMLVQVSLERVMIPALTLFASMPLSINSSFVILSGTIVL